MWAADRAILRLWFAATVYTGNAKNNYDQYRTWVFFSFFYELITVGLLHECGPHQPRRRLSCARSCSPSYLSSLAFQSPQSDNHTLVKGVEKDTLRFASLTCKSRLELVWVGQKLCTGPLNFLHGFDFFSRGGLVRVYWLTFTPQCDRRMWRCRAV